MAQVKVSLVIPSWNRIRDLQRLLDSVFSQDISGIETIVVDNASTDGTVEYLKDLK